MGFMMSVTTAAAIAVIAVLTLFFAIGFVVRLITYSSTPYGFRGKLLFLDDGSVKGFKYINRKYGIGATPDGVYEIGRNSLQIVEQKSRYKGIYQSDIAQAELGALTIGNHPKGRVKKATIANRTQTRTFRVPRPAQIYRKYRKEIDIARRIKRGEDILERKPEANKCASCRYFNECRDDINR